MKKVKIIFAALVASVLLFSLAACGGARGSLSAFVSAVKRADFEKAAEYVVGQPDLDNPESETGEMYQYIFEKAAGSFRYSVEEETMNSDETACTIEISYSGYSGTELAVKYAAAILTGSEATRSTVNDLLDDMEKEEATTTVVLVQNDDGDWLLEAATATALIAAIYG